MLSVRREIRLERPYWAASNEPDQHQVRDDGAYLHEEDARSSRAFAVSSEGGILRLRIRPPSRDGRDIALPDPVAAKTT